MKKILFLCTAISFFSSLYAQTPVPTDNVSGNWAISGSPYMVEGNIVVPGGQTLTIEAGVEIIFDSLYQFEIQGRIIASGTASDMITFTAADTTIAKRHGIRFDHTLASNDTSVFDYCNINYSDSSAISCLNFSKIKNADDIEISGVLTLKNIQGQVVFTEKSPSKKITRLIYGRLLTGYMFSRSKIIQIIIQEKL
jgi:hypothetical protein